MVMSNIKILKYLNIKNNSIHQNINGALKNFMLKIKINKKVISKNNRTYFIADIAANHDSSLERAKN